MNNSCMPTCAELQQSDDIKLLSSCSMHNAYYSTHKNLTVAAMQFTKIQIEILNFLNVKFIQRHYLCTKPSDINTVLPTVQMLV